MIDEEYKKKIVQSMEEDEYQKEIVKSMEEDYGEDSKSDFEDEKFNQTNKNNKKIKFPSGRELNKEGIFTIAAREKVRIVIIAGPSECGKTALITSLYQFFHDSNISNFYFAGSETIRAFENRAKGLRVDSGNDNPMVSRTQRGTVDSFLHLRLWEKNTDRYENLILSDFSGEDFDNARVNVEIVREELGILEYADDLVIMLDGEGLIDYEKRSEVIQKVKELFMTMQESEVLSETINIHFVTSKYDKVKARCNEDNKLKEFIEKIPDKVLMFNRMRRDNIFFMDIAAMPESQDIVPNGYGVNKLLDKWMNQKNIGFKKDKKNKSYKSEFNKLNWKLTGRDYG